jgi:hypothetical protein
MPVPLILRGIVTDMIEDVVYALPTRSVHIKADDVVELSLQTTTGFTAQANSTTGVQTESPFVRCTTATTKIIALLQ